MFNTNYTQHSDANHKKNMTYQDQSTQPLPETDENTEIVEEIVENQNLEQEKLSAQLEEQKDKYLRLVADFDNYKRRTAKERIELIQTASKDLVISLLDTLDDMDRAEKQLNQLDLDKAQTEGIFLVFNKLRSTLQAKGLKKLDSLHTDFDVEKHEAITEIPAVNEALVGKVLDEVQKGYTLNDKLIRFAKVVVGK